MKERNLFYFVTAVIASVLFLISLLIRLFPWFSSYGDIALPATYKLFIPVALLWVGWFFESKGFLLAALAIFAVSFGLQLDQFSVLSDNGGIYVPTQYRPEVRTAYVLGFVLFLASIGFGFYTYLTLELESKKV